MRQCWHSSALNRDQAAHVRIDRLLATSLGVMAESDLRSRYEVTVLGLRAWVAALRDEGRSSEMIARAVHAERRRLTATFKELTPEPLRSRIRSRTLAIYGDCTGPTIESSPGLGVRAGTTSSTARPVLVPGFRSLGAADNASELPEIGFCPLLRDHRKKSRLHGQATDRIRSHHARGEHTLDKWAALSGSAHRACVS